MTRTREENALDQMMTDPQIHRGAVAGVLPYLIDECRFTAPPRTNEHRVREADVLMQAFYAMTGVDPSSDADGPETALGDLMAHLMHWADAKDVSFAHCLIMGETHYEDELNEEETS